MGQRTPQAHASPTRPNQRWKGISIDSFISCVSDLGPPHFTDKETEVQSSLGALCWDEAGWDRLDSALPV